MYIRIIVGLLHSGDIQGHLNVFLYTAVPNKVRHLLLNSEKKRSNQDWAEVGEDQ